MLLKDIDYVINHKSEKYSGLKVKIIKAVDEEHYWVKPYDYNAFKDLESKKDEENQLVVVNEKFLVPLH